MNPALERILGYPAEEWAKRRLADTVHPDDREKVAAANRDLFSGKLNELVYEHRFVHKSGEVVWARVAVSLVRDKKKAPSRLIAIVEDVSESRRAEENAARARELTEKLLDTTDAMVVGLDSEGKIQFVNHAFEEITGYSRDDLEGKNWFETLVPRDRYPQVWEEFERLTSGGNAVRFENPILTKAGEERYIVWRNSEFRTGDEIIGTVSVGIDISERKRAEEELADSEEKLLAVFTSSPAGMAVSRREDGCVLDVNTEFERLFECRRDEVVEKTSIELGLWADPSDRKRVTDLIDRDGQVVDLELPLRTARGRALIGLLNVHEVTIRDSRFLIYALRDITEQKQAEEQLALLKHSIDVNSDGAYWTDTSDTFIYVNEAGYRVLDYDRDELLGKPVSLVAPGATPERMEEVWKRLRRDGFFTTESVHRRKDGSEFPVEMTSTYVQFGGREYHCAFARDISERKRQEHERELLGKQLTQAQKMEAVGRLSGGVAHNFNNILTALVGYCEILLSKLPEGRDGHLEAEQIRLAADHATSVTRELLLFSRREVGKRVKLDLNTIVVQTRLLLRQLIPSDVTIVAALASIVAPVKADYSQIEQVLVNLVLNAVDAMPDGGTIGLETTDLEIDKPLPVEGGATLEPGHYVALVVKDSGVGMDEETRAHIFEPFFSTKSAEKGTGLGLATVYGIIEESGGGIIVESKPKQGASFTIYFPALPAHG
jgi:two-component system cell cycle sensor histidine kinase/response regulator CckA